MTWRWVEMRAGAEKWQSIKDGDKEIAIVVPGFPPIGDERVANIIAAAPEMLEALEEAYYWLRTTAPADVVTDTRAAIAKARGEAQS